MEDESDTEQVQEQAKEATDVIPEPNNPMIAEYNQQRLVQAVKSYNTYDMIDPWDLLCEKVTTVKQLPERVVASVQLTPKPS
jgi:hypothetical protein